MSSLDATEEASAAVARAPRISKKYIEDHIVREVYVTGDTLVAGGYGVDHEHPMVDVEGTCPDRWQEFYSHHTICLLTTRSGFTVIGHSAPMDPRNFDEALGRTLAYENAFRQLWPLFAFAELEKTYY